MLHLLHGTKESKEFAESRQPAPRRKPKLLKTDLPWGRFRAQKMPWGKYRGKTIGELYHHDEGYVTAMIKTLQEDTQITPEGSSMLQCLLKLRENRIKLIGSTISTIQPETTVQPWQRTATFKMRKGKHSGKSFAEVLRDDPSFAEFMASKTEGLGPIFKTLVQNKFAVLATLQQHQRPSKRQRVEPENE